MSDTFVVPVTGMNGTNGAGVIPLDSVTPFAGPGTDFKAVAIGVGANIEALPAYFGDPLLGTGNLPGLAVSTFNNRALRQGTFVASSLCLWMSGQLNQYIPDDGNQINWQAEWQSALANFIAGSLGPGPDLGAYLPLVGGTMTGNIRFQAGISTILANNTWYYGLDTGGTPRGLLIKASDNNVYLNDGTAPYVVINGTPAVVNNVSWSGRDTSAAVRAVIGLLSDNQIHVGDSARAIYLDCGGASAWCSSNIVIPNNYYYYCRDTGGNNRPVLGINSGNALLIGSGAQAETDIYGNPIYMRNNAYALGQFQVNGYLYSQGGARCYIPGGNDPLQIYADHGYYARNHYIVGGTRDWSAGCLPGGNYVIADESAAAVRFQIDTAGNVTLYGGIQVNNGLTVYNGLYVVNGTFTTGSGTANINSGMNVWNALNVWSGGLYVAGGTLTVSGNVSVGGQVAAAYLSSSGNGYIDGNCHANQIQIGGLSFLYDGGGNYLSSPGSLNFGGTVQGSYLSSTGGASVGAQLSSNTFVTNYIHDWGSAQFDGSINCNNNVEAGQGVIAHGDCVVYGNFYCAGANFGGAGHLSASYGFCLGGAAFNYDYTWAAPIGNHTQWANGLGVYAQFFSAYCDATYKDNIVEVERDALAAILPIRFYQYDVEPHTTPRGEFTDNRTHVPVGVLAQQIRESLPDAVFETDQPMKFHMDHPQTDEPLCGWDTRPALGVDLMTLVAYQMRAIQQLAKRLEVLEAGRRR